MVSGLPKKFVPILKSVYYYLVKVYLLLAEIKLRDHSNGVPKEPSRKKTKYKP